MFGFIFTYEFRIFGILRNLTYVEHFSMEYLESLENLSPLQMLDQLQRVAMALVVESIPLQHKMFLGRKNCFSN